MPAFNSPLPRGSFPNYHESSPLRDKRDSDATGKQWQKSDNLRWQLSQIINNASQTNRQVQLLGRRILGMGPQNVAQNVQYGPFAVYKPVQLVINPITPYLTFDTDGNPVAGFFDSTVPTNLPTTCNPTTDGWRIFAMRDGLVSARGFNSILFEEQNWSPTVSQQFNIPLADFSTTISNSSAEVGQPTTDFVGFDYDIDPNDPSQNTNADVICLVLPGTVDVHGDFNFALWLQVDPNNFWFNVMAKQFSVGDADIFPNPTDSTAPPIAIISSIQSQMVSNATTTNLAIYQIQFGHVFNHVGYFSNQIFNDPPNLNQLAYNSTVNFKGNWNNDGITLTAFFPGDVVTKQHEIDFAVSSGTITITDTVGGGPTTKLYAQELWMSTVPGFTTDPSTDPDWFLYNGITLAPNTDPTPNTT